MSVFRSWRRGAVVAVVGVVAAAGLSGLATPVAGAATAVAVPTAASPDGGAWTVQPAPGGGAQVSWVSSEVLPVGGDRPEFLLDGVPLGPVLVEPDGRTLRLAAALPTPPNPADLDVELSGRLLDEPGQRDLAPRTPVASAPSGHVLPGDPSEPGPYDVADADYELPDFAHGGMHDLEMVGHVVAPVAAPGPRPVVLLLHGRHDWCYVPGKSGSRADVFSWPCKAPAVPVPSHLGYTYAQDLLASQGYLTVSVSADGINAQDGMLAEGGAAARAALVRRHLDALPGLDALDDLGVTADLDQVVLVGHSRGGEGVSRAAATIPLGAAYRVVGQVLLGPTNFGRQTAPYVPTVTVLPFCDGDVSDLQGQLYTDVARDVAPDDDALHSSVLVMGANHNFFNTEWTPGISAAPSFDDNNDSTGPCKRGTSLRLTAARQRTVGATYLSAAVATFGGSTDYLPLFDGSGDRVAPTADLDIRSHAIGGGRDVRRPGAGLGPDPADPSTRLCAGRMGKQPSACARPGPDEVWTTPHFTGRGEGLMPTRQAVETTWTAADLDARMLLEQPLDVSAAQRLEVRALLPLGADAAKLDVRLTDGAGHSLTVLLGKDGTLPAQPEREYGGTAVAQVLRVPTTGPNGAFDPADVRSVTLAFRGGSGRAWVLDLAVVPAGALPPVPAQRLRTLSFGRVQVAEGDSSSGRRVDIPYDVSGPAGVDGTVRVVTARLDEDGWPVLDRALDVSVPAGATSGSVSLHVPANRLDDLNHTLAVYAYPVKGVMPTSYVGELRVVDDDATPAFRASVRVSPVLEGRTLLFKARLARPVGYWTTAEGYPVRKPGARLRIGDLEQRFVKSWGLPGRMTRPRLPYAGRKHRTSCSMRPGRTSCVLLRLPVRRDADAEGTERVTLRVRAWPRGRVDRVGGRVRDR